MDIKYCSRGAHDVDKALFSKRSSSKDGLFSWCKSCMASYERERYQNGDRSRKERNRKASVKRAQDFIWSVLTSSQCVDCGETDPLVLEFDHQGDKLIDVSAMSWSYSISNIKKEMAKCEVRCANCHKKKTARDYGFWRSLR